MFYFSLLETFTNILIFLFRIFFVIEIDLFLIIVLYFIDSENMY
jgi:hypothetical protein